MSKQINILSVYVKDVLRAGEEFLEPENVTTPPKRIHPNVKLFKGQHGKGYLIAGDSASNPFLAPCSPADGAVLEEILGNPGEQLSGGMTYVPREKRRRQKKKVPLTDASKEKSKKDGEILLNQPMSRSESRLLESFDRVNNTSPFKMTPPPPKPHEVGHWYRRLSSAGIPSPRVTSHTSSERRRQGSKQPSSSRERGASHYPQTHDELTQREKYQESSTPDKWWHSVTPRSNDSSRTQAIHWIKPETHPVALDSSPFVPTQSTPAELPSSITNDTYWPRKSDHTDSLANFSNQIVSKTLLFLEQYRIASLEERPEPLVPLPLPKTSLHAIRTSPLSSSYSAKRAVQPPLIAFSSSEDSGSNNSSQIIPIVDSGNPSEPLKTKFFARGNITTLNISDRDANFRKNDERDRPPTNEGARVPFRSLVGLPFKQEILQNEFEEKRIREMNLLTSSMKEKRHHKRSRRLKPTPNSIFTQVSNPVFEEHRPILPGPFKRNVCGDDFGTRRPKKR